MISVFCWASVDLVGAFSSPGKRKDSCFQSAQFQFKIELGSQGIRVNAISPGPIETSIWSKTNLSADEINGFAEGVSQQVPLGRFGLSSEVAETALFLASDASSFINGAEVPVDGGLAQV